MVNNLEITELNYSQEDCVLKFTFLADGVQRKFTAKISDTDGIRGIQLGGKCEEFLYSSGRNISRLMKDLVNVTWSYIDGDFVDLPYRLI